jgi:hypothetical protein
MTDAMTFRPGNRAETRRRTPTGSTWTRTVIVAPTPYGALVRFPDGTEAPRPLADLRPCEQPPAVPKALPPIGSRVLIAPYPAIITGGLCFDERAKLIDIEGETLTVIVAGNSVLQHKAAQENADGVRRVRLPAAQVLADVPLNDRRVLVRSERGYGPRFVAGRIVSDEGNTVTVQADDIAGPNGRHILAIRYVYGRHGRALPEMMADEARGREAWETDVQPPLARNVVAELTQIAQRLESIDADTAQNVRAAITFPPVSLLLDPTVELARLRQTMNDLERPTLDLSVTGLRARLTVCRRDGGWGYQIAYRYRTGDMRALDGPSDHFTGIYPSREAAQYAGLEALREHCIPSSGSFSTKTQDAAAKRFLRRLEAVKQGLRLMPGMPSTRPLVPI